MKKINLLLEEASCLHEKENVVSAQKRDTWPAKKMVYHTNETECDSFECQVHGDKVE